MAKQKQSLLDLKNFITLKKGTISYLSGDEEFFIEEAIEYVKNEKLNESLKDFNYDAFYGRETEVSKIYDIIETLPMMAGTRLVMVRRAHELKDKDWQTLMPILRNPVPSTFLVFIGDKPDGRKNIIKEVLKSVTHFHFTKPFDSEFPQWVKYICKKYGLKIDDDAIQLLMQIVGPNLLEIKNEILKLGQYVGEKKPITAGDVMHVASRIKLQNVFNLTEAIGKCDQSRALMCLADLLDNGQNEVSILSMVHRHVRLLRQTRVGEQQEYTSQSRLWSERKIDKPYKVLCDTDRALKSSPVSSHIWLENFIMQTCQ